MKTILNITLSAALLFGAAAALQAAEYTKGVVKKLDTKAKKVTLIHEELKSLGMPGMTMVFRVKDETILAKLAKLAEGAEVEFVADRVDGKLTVTEVK